MAANFSKQPYLQIPPMHSAKKKDGKPLYELARAGIEIERDPKLCHLYQFEILSYEKPRATFRLSCSSGTYVRTLAQDFAKLLGSVGMLENLRRTGTGVFRIENASPCEQIGALTLEGRPWSDLPCWVPFDRLLDGYDRAQATQDEAEALFHGKQGVLFNILKRAKPHEQITKTEKSEPLAPTHIPVAQESCLAIFNSDRLIAVARKDDHRWDLERVFVRGNG